ncbi:39S ribosomal protein S18a, mitochondrial [Hylaeus anthracinus]|uniref:39S ribosomal protein S18a, mitochondrial n=1 Tax=Hylaeus anthracinus TaxID=313031 RepID=UPI0023B8A808|nr:39S ribosomal protein S18a, mitochondrial [Hylaeus anthracinus]
MAALFGLVKCLGKYMQVPVQNRNISLSATTYLKEIIEKKEGKTLTIEGTIVPDKHEGRLLKSKNGACLVCSSGLDIKHTDVLILSQFMTPNGNILPKRITGLCSVQQKRIGIMIRMAQAAGLLQARGKLAHIVASGRRFNTYYDERTIKSRYRNM